MAQLWDQSFWKPSSEPDKAPMSGAMLLPIAVLATITLGITVAAEPLFELTSRASDQLLHPQFYIDAVMKGGQRR
jgi:multicomponent Na+:H+ antiporter subunit D